MTARSPLVRAAAAGLLIALAGCAAQDATRFPSLLPRPIESRSDAEPVAPVAVATPDAALDRQLAALEASLKQNDRDFATAAATAEAAAKAAQGDPVGGERWITAQSALAELDGYRATSSSTLTDIEQIAIDRAAAGEPAYPALETARAAAQATLDAQTARIEAIQASLPAA